MPITQLIYPTLVFLLGIFCFGCATTDLVEEARNQTSPFLQTNFTQLAQVIPPADAKLVEVYSGLPRGDRAGPPPGFNRTREIRGFKFYANPFVPRPKTAHKINQILKNPKTYIPWRGMKMCGGFHPNFCFRWEGVAGTYLGLLCLGCDEFILIGPDAELYMEFDDATYEELERIITPWLPPDFTQDDEYFDFLIRGPRGERIIPR